MRNFGIEQALRVARYAASDPHRYVVGFSMAGDEAGFPAHDFAEVFAIAAGVRVTLGSDDPPYFGATIAGEYALCAARLGFSEDDLREITRTAIDAAFYDDDLREALRARL